MRPEIRTVLALALSLAGCAVALPATARPTQVAPRRFDMLAMGVDMMPVGTAKQVDRMKRMRRQMP